MSDSDFANGDFSPSPSKKSEGAASLKRRSTFGQTQFEDLPPYQRLMKNNFPKVVDFVEGNGFESAMGIIIMYNCLTIGIEVHECPPENSLRFQWADSCPTTFLAVSENICTFIFVTEFMLRGFCSGFKYHFASWDRWADVGLVWGTGVLLTWIIVPAMGGTGPSEVRMLTALRAFRLLRVARVIRFNFKEMWLMLRGLAGSSKALGSMIAVFVFVFYLFGILAVTLIADSTAIDSEDEDIMAVHEFFNGLDKSMWTLLQMITADSWSSGIARPLINVIPSLWIYFVCYIAIAMMVLMNLVTAIIVENAMNQSKEDQESMLNDLQKKKTKEFQHLNDMFLALDTDGSGELDEEEFANALDDIPEIIDQFKLLGFEENETRNFFTDLDNGDGSLSTEEFIGGVQAMQGTARSADLIRTQKLIERLTKRMDKMIQHFGLVEETPSKDGAKGNDAESELEHEKEKQIEDPDGSDAECNFPGSVPDSPSSRKFDDRKTVADRRTVASPMGGASVPAALEIAKQQLEIAQETSQNLERMWLDVRRKIDEKLGDVQSVMMDTRKNTGGGQEIDKQWLYDVRVTVAETCRKELARQLEKAVADSLAAGVLPPKPVTPPPQIYGQTLPGVPSLPKKKSTTPQKAMGNRMTEGNGLNKTYPGVKIDVNKNAMEDSLEE